MEFKKSVLTPLVLSVVGIFLAVATFVTIQVASKIGGASSGPSPLAIFALVFSILFLTALSAKKAFFAKIVTIISIASIVLTSFIVAIVCSVEFQSMNVTWDSITFLTLGILSFVSMVLFLVYYLIGKKDTLKKLAFIINISSMIFFGLFAIVLVVSAFAGQLKTDPMYGIELALLSLNIVLILGIVLALQNNLGRIEVAEAE